MSGCFVALLLLSLSFHRAVVAAVFPRNPFDGTDKADTNDVDAVAANDDDDADVVFDDTGVAAFSFLIGVLLVLVLVVCIVI